MDDVWALGSEESYELSVHGPNGFYRGFKGRAADSAARLVVRSQDTDDRNTIELTVTNTGTRRVTARVVDQYAGRSFDQILDPGETTTRRSNVRRFDGWYELVVTALEDNQFVWRVAGHVENGKASYSDPLMGGLV